MSQTIGNPEPKRLTLQEVLDVSAYVLPGLKAGKAPEGTSVNDWTVIGDLAVYTPNAVSRVCQGTNRSSEIPPDDHTYCMSFYGPERNDGKHVFVFGSNEAGRHGKGAAYVAKTFWGAKYSVGEGRQGMSYAIPTKDKSIKTLPLETIRKYVRHFLAYAEQHPELNFLVTKIGCGLAGYTDSDISPFFAGASRNVILPSGWKI